MPWHMMQCHEQPGSGRAFPLMHDIFQAVAKGSCVRRQAGSEPAGPGGCVQEQGSIAFSGVVVRVL